MLDPAVIAIRIHDARRAWLLERALWSVAGQSCQEVQALVVCQGFSSEELHAVQRLMDEILGVAGIASHTVNVANPEGKDLRSRLLNVAISYSREQLDARYLMFLDYDDLLFSHAVETLVRALQLSDAALAFADVHVAHVHGNCDGLFVERVDDLFGISRRTKLDILSDNFLPIHSYMFALDRMSADSLRYDENLARLEDYELLLRIGAEYPWTPLARSRLIGLYNFYSSPADAVNTSPNVFLAERLHEEEWARAKRYIVRKLGGLEFRSFVGDWPAGLKSVDLSREGGVRDGRNE